MPTSITEIGRLHYEITGDSKNLVKSVKDARTQTEQNLDALTKKFIQAVDQQVKAEQAGQTRRAEVYKRYQRMLAHHITNEQKQMKDHASVMQNLQPTSFLGKLQQKMQQGFGEGNAGALMGLLGFTAVGAVAAAIGTKFVEVAGAIIKRGITEAIEAGAKAAEIERSEIALTAITGSAVEAKQAIGEMIEMSRTQPGLTFEAAIEGNQRLRAVRFSAEEAKKAVEGLAKVRLLSGSTKQDLEAVLLNFQQIRSYGKLTGDELRETLMRMPYMSEVFLRAFGTINTEKIKELNLSSDELFTRIFDAMEHLPEVTIGASTAWEKWENQIGLSQLAFGSETLTGFIDLMGELTRLLAENEDGFAEWGKEVGQVLHGAAKAVTKFRIAVAGTGFQPAGNDFSPLDVLIPGWLPLRKMGEKPQREAQQKEAAQTMGQYIGRVGKKAENEQTRQQEANFKEMERAQKQSLDLQLESLRNYYQTQSALQLNFNRYSMESEMEYLTRRARLIKDEAAEEVNVRRRAFESAKALVMDRVKAAIPADKAKTYYAHADLLADLDSKLQEARAKQLARSKEQELEIERTHTENLSKISTQRRDDALAAANATFRLSEAAIRRRLVEDLETESQQLAEISAMRERHYREQVAAQVAFFNEQTELYKSDAGKVAELEREKNRVLFSLHVDHQAAIINNDRETYRVLDEMRRRDILRTEAAFQQRASRAQNIADSLSLESLNQRLSSQWLRDGPLGVEPDLRKRYEQMLKLRNEIAASATLGLQDPQVEAMNQAMDELGGGIGYALRMTSGLEAQVVALIEQYKQGLGGNTILDQIREKMFEVERAAGEVPFLNRMSRANLDRDAGIISPAEATRRINDANEGLLAFRASLRTREADAFANSLTGLTQKLAALRQAGSGDRRAQRDVAAEQVVRDQISVLQGIDLANARLAESSEAVADRIALAHAETALEMKSKYEEAMIAIDRAQQELADKTVYHHEQVMAKIMEAINTAPGITDILGEAQAGAILDFYKLLDDSVAGFVKQLGLADTAFGNFIQTMLAGLAKLAAAKLFELLFGASTSGGGGGQGSGGGGWLGRLFGMLLGAVFGGLGFGGGGGGGNTAPAGPYGSGTMAFTGGGGGGTVTGLSALSEPITLGKEGLTDKDTTGTPAIAPTFVFNANPQTGKFSQESAEQSVRKLMMLQSKIARR